jgi:acyl-CoA dehydrogenase
MTDANMIADSTQRLFHALGNPQAIRNNAQRELRLWQALKESGLTRAWVPDSLNGSGATLTDGFNILRIAGEFAVNVPLAETLLAGWLLTRAEIPVPDSAITVAPVDPRDWIALSAAGTLSGSARTVPFARNAEHVVVLAVRDDQTYVALVDRKQCQLNEHANLAGEARDHITLTDVAPSAMAATSIDFDTLMLMGAAVRTVQMAGALQGILDLSVAYANERIAFEKPIGKFQAIQHALAKLAGETAAAIAAASSAADAISTAPQFDTDVFLEIASAKIRVGEAVTAGAAIAHQVHGAIGFSQEHVLHRYTQRLWAWRDDFGSESDWAVKLGQLVTRNGADALWPMLAAR